MPILREDMKRLRHTIYHLDGVGELKHLDALLSLPELNAIQWVYGVGQPGPHAWMDLYRKVENAGKQVMIIENGGVLIRVPASSINIYKRDVQGVIVMRVEEGNQIVSIERVAAEEETEA